MLTFSLHFCMPYSFLIQKYCRLEPTPIIIALMDVVLTIISALILNILCMISIFTFCAYHIMICVYLLRFHFGNSFYVQPLSKIFSINLNLTPLDIAILSSSFIQSGSIWYIKGIHIHATHFSIGGGQWYPWQVSLLSDLVRHLLVGFVDDRSLLSRLSARRK